MNHSKRSFIVVSILYLLCAYILYNVTTPFMRTYIIGLLIITYIIAVINYFHNNKTTE